MPKPLGHPVHERRDGGQIGDIADPRVHVTPVRTALDSWRKVDSVRPTSTVVYPSAAKRCAIWTPSPPPAPVITATRPFWSFTTSS